MHTKAINHQALVDCINAADASPDMPAAVVVLPGVRFLADINAAARRPALLLDGFRLAVAHHSPLNHKYVTAQLTSAPTHTPMKIRMRS